MGGAMTWPFTSRGGDGIGATAASMIGDRTASRLSRRRVSREEALRHSAVWACLRLRADLISTMPVDVYRKATVDGRKIMLEQTRPPVLEEPGGPTCRWMEWAYGSQVDLDSAGNFVGLILARDSLGKPARIEPLPADDVTFIGKGTRIEKVRCGRDEYDYSQIWHEKQYTMSGVPIGLSPIAKAAMQIGGYLSAQEFAHDWFGNYTMPGGHLQNTAKKLDKDEAVRVKAAFKNAVNSGDVWVSGKDWEYSMLSAKASESAFIQAQEFSVLDVCRFLGVPGDMIDASAGGSSVTYANITQRNLQLLIMNIGPAIRRREEAVSYGILPRPRQMKLNPNALLRMDLRSRYEGYKVGIDSRFMTPDEARELEDMPPLEPEQVAEFATLFPNKAPAGPTTGGVTP